MKQNFDNHSFRDFEYIPGIDAWARARMFQAYLDDQTAEGQLNYRLVTPTGCGPTTFLNGHRLISLVSNDYLGFTRHPAVIKAAIRELSANAVRRQKAWHIKEDFITLWFISAGRFPELAAYGGVITHGSLNTCHLNSVITKSKSYNYEKGQL